VREVIKSTYYVVGHFHYVLSMGAVFGMLAAFYYWIPKIVGKSYSSVLGKIHFWTMFIGVNMTFFPMHFLGLSGMPRRIPDYPDAFTGWNFIASFGSIISVVSSFVFLYLLFDLLIRKEYNVSPNYWQVPSFFESQKGGFITNAATSLEWSLSSPPNFHCFNHLPTQS
jgi:cytochrome c oxidase subunit 1